MNVDKKEDVDPAGVTVTDHLVIRDRESQRVLVNVRQTAKNLPNPYKDKESNSNE
jgi:hypothetical protein